MARNISIVTRRDLSILLTQGWDEDGLFGGYEHHYYNIWGLLSPPEFLIRLYPLQNLPSIDNRVENAECDIHLHTVTNPNDYDDDWFWTDDRFNNAECDIHLHTVTNPNDYDDDWFWTDDPF